MAYPFRALGVDTRKMLAEEWPSMTSRGKPLNSATAWSGEDTAVQPAMPRGGG